MPNTPKGGGISRKIFNPADRKKIRSILNEIEIPKEMGLIVRTAGSNKTKNEINQDLETLKNTWNQIKDTALNSIAPSLVHQESEIIKRTLRDMYDENTKNVIIEGNEGYKKAQNFMKMMMPSHVKKIKKYRGKVPLFIEENIEQKLNQIFESEIKLNSGGYLVINPTEALVSIDINSGSSIKQKNVESTALDTNLEAAEEISRQIKIRDLSGLIIIDFIDMLSYGNRRMVERRLKEKCRTDRARIQIGRISNFGLLEMSRQRLRESAVKWKVELTDESFAQKLLKIVEIKSVLSKAKFVELKVCEKISDFLKENFVDDLTYFEKKNKMKIDIITDNSLIIPEYIIDLKNKSNKTIELVEHYEKLKNLEQQKVDEKLLNNKENKKFHKKKNFKKKFFKKKTK
jgi:ribonuclease E